MRTIKFEAENVSHHAPLYIGDRSRLGTVTGVVWLDAERVAAAHAVGKKLAIFDVSTGRRFAEVATPHVPDLLCRVGDALATSDTDASSVSLFSIAPLACLSTLRADPGCAHGVSCSGLRSVFVSFSRGPARLERWRLTDSMLNIQEREVWGLSDWKIRDALVLPDGSFLIVAGEGEPTVRSSYRYSSGLLKLADGQWTVLNKFVSSHIDSCRLYGGRVYVTNQYRDLVMALEPRNGEVVDEIPGFSFPHGIDFSPDGRMAVTCYGTSTIEIRDPQNNYR